MHTMAASITIQMQSSDISFPVSSGTIPVLLYWTIYNNPSICDCILIPTLSQLT